MVPFEDVAADLREQWLDRNAERVAAVVTNGHIGCPGSLIGALPNLAIIAIHGVGFDKVDLAAARSSGVVVTNTPGVLTDDVADLAVGLVISLLRGIPAADRFVRAGRWAQSEFRLATSVTGKRFGIVGLGRIGQTIAVRLAAFGPVAYTGPREKPVQWRFHADAFSLAQWSDVLVIASAASERTRGLVGREVIEALGPDGYLINVARGSIVDEHALSAALAGGTIAGAALDVFASEPQPDPALIASDRTVLTPHIGSATIETRRRMADMVIANLDAFLAGGQPPNQVQA